MTSIDLNADLGEGFGRWDLGDDAGMLDIVTSANVACGFHAGDPERLLATLRSAAERDVRVGAHVAYRDLVGFGRRFVDASVSELTADVIYQIGALQGLARAAGTAVHYIKPHGALYNTIATHEAHASAVIAAIRAVDASLPLVVLSGSPLATWAEQAGLRVVHEVFADRAYTPEGALVGRREPDAVLHDADATAERMWRLVVDGRVAAIDGSELAIRADSVCVHGDSPAAVDIARTVRARLEGASVELRPFVVAAGGR